MALTELQQQSKDALAANDTAPTVVAPDPIATPTEQANTMLSGVTSAMSESDIFDREAKAKEANRLQVENIYRPLIEGERTAGENRLGSGKGQLGQSRGLGLSTAGLSFLNSIQEDTTNRIAELEKQKQAAISSGNFQASEQAQTALDRMQDTQNNLIFKKAELALQITGQEQEEAKENRDQALDNMNLLMTSNVPIGDISSEERSAFESNIGLPTGTFDKFYTNYQEIQNAQSLGDEVKEQQSLVNLLQDLPVGETIEIGGIEYKSLAEEENKEQGLIEGLIQKYPDAGITVSDSLTDAQAKIPLSRIYQKNTLIKPTGKVDRSSERTAVAQDIAQIKGDDNYVDTKKYGQIRESVAVNSPELLTWFDGAYPPNLVLNPNDSTAKKFLGEGKGFDDF